MLKEDNILNSRFGKKNHFQGAFEESGRKVEPVKIIAVQDRNHHNKPILATNVTKIFFL